jgi:predicted DNA-binding protein YlxM (UPF0122 family)
MSLDSLASRERNVALLERYGTLLNDHQQRVLDLHLRRDWSLAEVARHQETSRAAVHDLVRRAVRALEEYERRLGLLEEERRRKERLGGELAALRRRVSRLEAEVTGL